MVLNLHIVHACYLYQVSGKYLKAFQSIKANTKKISKGR